MAYAAHTNIHTNTHTDVRAHRHVRTHTYSQHLRLTILTLMSVAATGCS